MATIGISLGWRCESAERGVELGLRAVKAQGYGTCPFDLCVTNYDGMIKCIKDDFKYFCDPRYLVLKKTPPMRQHLGNNQNDEEFFIYNTYYNFCFNHESPGHSNLYNTEEWPDGINHFVNNDFQKFIERYQKRIDNFRNYINNDSNNKIIFLLSRYNYVPYELEQALVETYPNLDFQIYCWTNLSQNTIEITTRKTFDSARDFEIEYLKYMGYDDCSHELDRYSKIEPLVNTSDRIVLHSL